jgi:Nodulation protein Z (NodZ)
MTRSLIVKGKAGFGNRILSALTGLLYARLTGRKLMVDWSDFVYSQDGSNSFPKLFDCPDALVTKIPDTDSVCPEVWRNQLHRSANDLLDQFDSDQHSNPRIYRKYSFDFRRLDYPQELLVMWCFTHHISQLRPNFPGRLDNLIGLTDDEILVQLLRESMRPQPIVTDRVQAFREKHFGPKVIAAHIRFMDRKTSVLAARRGIEKLRMEHPDAQIFLATDSVDVQKEFQKTYGNIISTEKWFPPSGASMHQNLECKDRFNNGVQALTDLYLMASCSFLVYPSSSTFSNMARLIGALPPEHVVDTERYNLKIRAKRLVRAWIA